MISLLIRGVFLCFAAGALAAAALAHADNAAAATAWFWAATFAAAGFGVEQALQERRRRLLIWAQSICVQRQNLLAISSELIEANALLSSALARANAVAESVS